jgi:hypothetical protein
MGTPSAKLVWSIVRDYGWPAAMERWGGDDGLSKSALRQLCREAKRSEMQRPDAEFVMECTRILGSVVRASRELGMGQATIVKMFRLAGEPTPKIDAAERGRVTWEGRRAKAAARAAMRVSSPPPPPVKPTQLELFG